jgi:hypothetical protein
MKTLVKEHQYFIPRNEIFLSEEGVSIFKVLNDHREDKNIALEKHSNDLYKFFLRKFSTFEARSLFDKSAARELKVMLRQFIKVKELLEEDK